MLHCYFLRGCSCVLLAILAGCCVSYHRLAVVDSTKAMVPPEASALLAVVEKAVKPLGLRGRLETSLDEKFVAYNISDGRINSVNAMIDKQTRNIGLGWQWNTQSEFVSRVQNAIELEFTRTYGTTLQFKDRACGWLGP